MTSKSGMPLGGVKTLKIFYLQTLVLEPTSETITNRTYGAGLFIGMAERSEENLQWFFHGKANNSTEDHFAYLFQSISSNKPVRN